jgi:hypothetical protein
MSKTPRQIKADGFMEAFTATLSPEQKKTLGAVIMGMVFSKEPPKGVMFGAEDTDEPAITNTVDYITNYMYSNTPSNFTPSLKDKFKDTLNSSRELYKLEPLTASDQTKYKNHDFNYILWVLIALIILILGFLIFRSMNKPSFSPMTAFGNRIRRIVGGKH